MVTTEDDYYLNRGRVLTPTGRARERSLVRDGHHGISVARAFGQEQIDAEVMVWDLVGPLPWEAQAPRRPIAGQAA